MQNSYFPLKNFLVDFQSKGYSIPVVLGMDGKRKSIIKDFTEIKNLLIAGSTGTGKTVFIDCVISTILTTKTPEDVNFILIDPKMGVGSSEYYNIQSFIFPVITSVEEASKALTWCIGEIEERKRKQEAKNMHQQPRILLIVDEFADLMLYDDEMPEKLVQIAKHGYEVGIHMILSTSSPRDKVFTKELTKAIPGRIAGALPSEADSKRVLGQSGAEELLGNGDMIYINVESNEEIRVQTPYISYEEIQEIISNQRVKNEACHCTDPECRKCLLINCHDDNCKIHPLAKKNKLRAQYLSEKIAREEQLLFERAREVTLDMNNITTNFLQRYLKIGYNKAARIKELLDKEKDDPLFESAKELVLEEGKATPSFIARRMKIGHNQSARIFMRLQEEGIISKFFPFRVI